MKVLIATGIYPPDIGGPATYSETLTRELINRGHRITVVTYSSQRIKNKELRIRAISRKWPLPIRYCFYSLAVFFSGLNTDLIYVQDPVSVGLSVMVAAWFLRKPYILKIVGDYAWEQSQIRNQESLHQSKHGTGQAGIRNQELDEFLQTQPSGKIKALWNIERWVARHARKIIVPSNYLKSVVLRWGMPEEKIKVIYNSFDWQSVVLPKVSAKIPDHDIIYSVGRLVPWKGFDTLIEVIADLISERPNLELVIYGDGPERENLEYRIKNLGLVDSVRLLGRIEHEKLLEKLQGERKFFVLNSSYEGMSHQILECQALKIPCAVSRVGGNPEIIEDGKTGLLFEYNNKEQIKNAILRLINDEQLVSDIKEHAYQQIIGRHDFNNMIERTIHVLRSAL